MIDFSKARVAVVGDLIEDHWIYGRVDRLSPEGPWPVFVPEKTVKQPGGAANVAANMRALGADPVILTPSRVAIKERYVVGRHQLFRVDREDATPITAQEALEVYFQLSRLDPHPDVVVLSDYGKGSFGGGLAQAIIPWCNGRGIKIVVDPKGTDWTKYQGATVITPNDKEAQAVSGDWPRSSTILVTHGDKGMQLWPAIGEKPGDMITIPAQGPKVVDTVGAGDTVVAALALALGAGYPMKEAAHIANAAAGVAVGKPGTSVCTLSELRQAYRGDLPEIGIANGCFDILHAGHVELLNAAKRRCQKLVVAINSDASVARLKGRGRPMNDLATRTYMLASLGCVDEVRVYDQEEDLVDLIKEVGASVIFKGADYEGHPTITGKDIARVEIIKTEFKSSTAQEVCKARGVWS